jgi:cardiolipin synthase
MRALSPSRVVADQALSRAAGGPLVEGNAVRLLKDAAENYPAWLDAIAAAQRTIHFEIYILHDDAAGRRFSDALIAKAREGVKVRLIYDWIGALNAAGPRFWRRLRDGGVEVRAFNPPRVTRPLAWLVRDHRKALIVDDTVAYVSGLCVGEAWEGTRDAEPWRDTGVEIRGPAVADVQAEFAEVWAEIGTPLPPGEVPRQDQIAKAGTVSLRVVGTRPAAAGMLRLDSLVAGLARERLWITDAYFVGVPGYTQALRAAAADGVDVRLLVPGGSDLPLVRSLSRAGYRALLEGGVRVFEWNGSMVHAKTAVADGLWARVGSTNLNIQSWMGNWELDVAIEDPGFGAEMERMFEADLERSTEVVLAGPLRTASRLRQGEVPLRRQSWMRRRRGQTSRAAAGAFRIGNTVGAALTARRPLGAAEASILAIGGLFLILLGALAAWKPRGIAYPIAAVAIWLGLSLAGAAWRTWRQP